MGDNQLSLYNDDFVYSNDVAALHQIPTDELIPDPGMYNLLDNNSFFETGFGNDIGNPSKIL